jgi:hypothetical protein
MKRATLASAFRCATLVAVLALADVNARGQQAEWLYGIRSNNPPGGGAVERMDPTTAQVEAVWAFLMPITVTSVTSRTDRLLTTNLSTWPDSYVDFHPADASRVVWGSTGFNEWTGILSIERSPATGIVYLAGKWTLYSIDIATGLATTIGSFTGQSFPGDTIYSLAIDSSGVAYATGAPNLQSQNTLYRVDLSNANLTVIADVTVPGGHGEFKDLAFSSTGELWGCFWDIGWNPPTRGLYKIDLNNYSAVLVRQVAFYYLGLAFLPVTDESFYCSGKVNSLGCTPEISADGFPSPTASTGYSIRAADVRNQSMGALVCGISGRATTPFGGGTLCLVTPFRRTIPQSSSGSAPPASDCSGTWSLDFNTWMDQHTALPAGTVVQCQWLGRDGGFAPPNAWTLSNALEFVVRL